MARSIWKGSISFGLVNVPVELYSTTQDKSVRFHTLTKDGKCRLRQKLYCPDTKKEYDYSQTAKGFEISPEKYVVLDRKELDALKPRSGHTIDITDFVGIQEIDPVYYENSYYLAPDKRSGKAYRLLHQSMKKAGKVAVAKFVMRQKEYLAIVRPIEDCLCLQTMHYQNEIVKPDSIAALDDYMESAPKVGPKELKIAEQLIESMTTKFDPGIYEDEYAKVVRKLVQQKSKGKTISAPEASGPKSGKIIDLMDALKKSLEKDKNPTSTPRVPAKRAPAAKLPRKRA